MPTLVGSKIQGNSFPCCSIPVPCGNPDIYSWRVFDAKIKEPKTKNKEQKIVQHSPLHGLNEEKEFVVHNGKKLKGRGNYKRD